MTGKKFLIETGISNPTHMLTCRSGYIPLHTLLNKFAKANIKNISNEQIKTDFFDALRHDFVEEGDDGTEYNQADAVYKWLVELAELRVYKKEAEESRAKNEEE